MKHTNRIPTIAGMVMALAMLAVGTSGAATLTAYYDFEGTGADRFDDPAGAFADDLVQRLHSDGGNDASFITSDTPGPFAGSQAASFNGNRALSTQAYTTDLGPDPHTYTIMFWIKARDSEQENNNTRLMTSRVAPNGSNTGISTWQVEGFGNSGANGDKMDVRMNGASFGTGNWFSTDATNALARDDQGSPEDTITSWHHVTYVLSDTGHSGNGGAYGFTYVDGVQIGGEYDGPNADWDNTGIGNLAGQLIIGGAATNAGNRGFTGLLDDVALFSGAVSPTDIAAIAAGNLSPATFIPEPSSTLLSSLGLALFLLRRRRR